MSWPTCPECGDTKTSCIDSRWSAGYVRRRYKCASNHRWSTVELSAELLKGYNMVSGSYHGQNFALVPHDALEKMEGDFMRGLEMLRRREVTV